MDSEITMDELDATIKSFPKGKVGGCNGTNAEFYQFFWSKLCNMYHDALKYALEKGMLHLSACRGMIALIPKKSKNLSFLTSWRPLTMLNLSYKILAKVLATCIKVALPYLISEDQYGFMENRQISSCIHRTVDVIDHTNTQNWGLLAQP